MTEKRFGIIKTKTYGLYVPVDKMKVYNFSSFESELDCIRVVNALNDLSEENEQLRKEIERKEKIIRDKSELVRQQVNVSENLQARINILERALEEEE